MLHRTIIEMCAVWIHTRESRGKKFQKIHRQLWWSTVDARLTNSNGILDELTLACCAMVRMRRHIGVSVLVLRNHRLRIPLRSATESTKNKRWRKSSTKWKMCVRRAWAKNAIRWAETTTAEWNHHISSEIYEKQ